jgi:hypothetical protein
MSIYTVTDPTTNKTVELEGDSPPTEQELEQIFSQVGGSQPDLLQGSANAIRGVGKAIGDFVAPIAKTAMQYSDPYNSQFGSPQNLAVKGAGMLMKADTFGRDQLRGEIESANEQATRDGMNPYLSAGIGAGLEMTPDFLTGATPKMAAVQGPKRLFRSASQPMAQRALGLTKQHLKTPFARGKAAQAAEVALEQKIIPPFGNPAGAMERAVALQDDSGKAIGAMRESAGSSPLDPIFDSLEAARQRATDGMRGGAWDTIHNKFDEAQETLMSLLNQGDNVSLAAVEKTKKLLGNTVNWVAANVSQDSAKQISSAIERGVETIMKAKGIDMTAYGAQKRLFGASKTMQKGLSNEVAAQAGNNAFSLPTVIAAGGQLATGNVPAAVGTLGIVEALRRRGMGIGARVLEGTSGVAERQLGAGGNFLRVGRGAGQIGGIAGGRRLLAPQVEPVLQTGNQFKRLFNNPKNAVENSSDGNQRKLKQLNNQGNKQENENNNNGNSEGGSNHRPLFNPSSTGKSSKNMPKKVKQNGHIYIWNEKTGRYE